MKKSVYKKIAVVYNPEQDLAKECWTDLQRWLKTRKLSVIGGSQVTASMRQADLVVALGGDGTVLRVARAVSGWNIPVLGVNVGRLGFLAATEVGATYRTLTRVLSGHSRVENRIMLSVQAVINKKPLGPFLALNEVVVRGASSGRVLTLHAGIQKRLLATYRGDGLIVSTPTGSTAYNLAASGPIVHPDVDVLILCPICPHSLAQRPVVVPTSEVIEISVDGPNAAAVLSLDGQINHPLNPGDTVEVRRAHQSVPLLMDPERSFYQVLQSKLKWGGA